MSFVTKSTILELIKMGWFWAETASPLSPSHPLLGSATTPPVSKISKPIWCTANQVEACLPDARCFHRDSFIPVTEILPNAVRQLMPDQGAQCAARTINPNITDSIKAKSSELYALISISISCRKADRKPSHRADNVINTSRGYGRQLGVPFTPADV